MKFAHFSSENSGQNNGRTSPFWGKNSRQGLVLKQGFPVFTIMRVLAKNQLYPAGKLPS